MLALALATSLALTIEPGGPSLEFLLRDASFVVLAEAVEVHELDGTSVEEVQVVRTLKGEPPAGRLFYAPPCGCGGVARLAEKGEKLLLFLWSGEREVQTRGFGRRSTI